MLKILSTFPAQPDFYDIYLKKTEKLVYIRHTRIPELWTQMLDDGIPTMNSRLWALNSGLWTLDSEC